MRIKEIKTLNDYEEALKRIEELWDSLSETDQSELDKLVNLIEEYEKIHYSIN